MPLYHYCFLLIPCGVPPSPVKNSEPPVRLVWSQGQSTCMLMTDKSLSFFMSCLKAQSVFFPPMPKHSPYNVPSVSSFLLFPPPPCSLCQGIHAHKDTYLLWIDVSGLQGVNSSQSMRARAHKYGHQEQRRMICATEAIYCQQLLSGLHHSTAFWLLYNLNIKYIILCLRFWCLWQIGTSTILSFILYYYYDDINQRCKD